MKQVAYHCLLVLVVRHIEDLTSGATAGRVPLCMYMYKKETYRHAHVRVYVCVFVHVCIYVCMHACMHVYVYMYVDACMYVCMYVG